MQTLGIIDITWRGRRLDVEKGAKLMLGGIKNNPVTFGRMVGRAQEFVASEITATVPFRRGQSIGDVFAVTEGELIAECDTGQIFTWADAFLVDRPTLTGGEGGKIELKWQAGEAQELLP